MTLPIRWTVGIDWNNTGVFAPGDEDATLDLRGGTVSRGRGGSSRDFGAGTAQLRLLNTSGKYSPYNTASPIYPNVLPGRQVRLEAVHNAITYPVFRGYIDRISEARERDREGRPFVTLDCSDGFERLSRGSIRVFLLENQNIYGAAGLLTQLLAEIDWPSGQTDFDGGLRTIDQRVGFYWAENSSPLEAFRRAAAQDPGSCFFISRDGKLTVLNRYDRSAQPIHTTLAEPQVISTVLNQKDFVDAVEIARAGLAAAPAAVPIFTLAPAGRMLVTGSPDENTINGEFAAAAKGVVTPVRYTDYLANSEQDGSGEDRTKFAQVASMTSYGGGFEVLFQNTHKEPIYLRLSEQASFQVRGRPIERSSEGRTIRRADDTSIVRDQVYKEEFAFQDDVALLTAYATHKLGQLTTPQPRPPVTLPLETDAAIVAILGAELGYRIHVTNTASIYATELDADFFIEAISLRFAPARMEEATWELSHEDLAGGNFFRISGAAGAGADRSLIGGEDRLAY